MFKFTRKRGIVLGLVAAVVVTATAVAYWTSQGSGSGTGTAGAGNGVAIEQVVVADGIYPGGDAAVTFAVKNLATDGSKAKVGKVVTDSITTDKAGCDAADFSFADVAINKEIGATPEAASGTLEMANTSANQDACKSAKVTLNLKVDNAGL